MARNGWKPPGTGENGEQATPNIYCTSNAWSQQTPLPVVPGKRSKRPSAGEDAARLRPLAERH